jgi:hypothetical protein
MGWALNIRWLWLKKTQPNRPWAEFEVRTHPMAAALFAASMCSVVGNGTSTMFWSDNWLNGMSLTQIAPALSTRISIRIKKKNSPAGFDTSTMFWSDNWLNGMSLTQIAPALSTRISIRIKKKKQSSRLWHLHYVLVG